MSKVGYSVVVILIVIIGKECVVFKVAKLTALLMFVVNHGGRAADIPALLLLHLFFEASLMFNLLIVEVVIAVVAPVIIILLFILLTIVDLLHILIFLIRILILLHVTAYHILVVVSLMMQQFHILFKIRFALCHSIVRVLDWRTLLDHLILSGLLLLLTRRGLFRGGRYIDWQAVEVKWRHSVGSRFDINFEQVEAGVARLTVKSNVALTFHVLVLLRRVVVAQVAARGVTHAALRRVVEQLVAAVAVGEPARGDGLDLRLEDLVHWVAPLVQLEDQIHELALLVAGVPIKSKGRTVLTLSASSEGCFLPTASYFVQQSSINFKVTVSCPRLSVPQVA